MSGGGGGGGGGGIFCTGENLPSDTGKRKVHYSALKKLCALRTRSHWRCSSLFARGRHRTRFVNLVYLHDLSYLTCSNRLRSRCLSSRRWRSVSPSTSDHSPSSLRSECFPFAPHKLPNFSDQQHIQMSRQIRSARGYTHAQNRACSAGGHSKS